MNVQQRSDLNKNMMWPSSENIASQHTIIPATAHSMPTSVHFFPNGMQLNQLWMDSLAKGMAQEQVTQKHHTQQIRHQQQSRPPPPPRPPPQQQQQQQQQQQYVEPSMSAPIDPSVVMMNTMNSINSMSNFQQQHQQQQQQHQNHRVNSMPNSMLNATFSPVPAPIQVQATTSLNLGLPRISQAPSLISSSATSSQQNLLSRSVTSSQQNLLARSAAAAAAANSGKGLLLDAEAEKERKRKNREFAKRSREKRRNEHKLLEDELFLLQKENVRLRQIVQNKIPEHAQDILKKCCKDHPLHHAAVKQGVNDALATSDFHLLENLIKEQQSFCMTDPMQADNPIVYASENFYQLTGYTREEVLGRNCRFLQGKDTDPKSVALIAESIKKGKDTSVNLLNYKANGTPFWNSFFIVALRNHSGKIVNFLGVQCEIEDPDGATHDNSFYKVIEEKNKSIRIKGEVDIGALPSDDKPASLISEADEGLQPNPFPESHHNLMPLDAHGIVSMDDENRVDWSMLANVLEDDFRSGLESSDFDVFDDNNTVSLASIGEEAQSLSEEFSEESDTEKKTVIVAPREAELEYRTLNPRALVTRTCRSELVDSLLSSHGDVTNPRFLKALQVISSIYASSDPARPVDDTSFIDNYLNSAWVSLSRPAYDGCLGSTERGDYMYALGKMSFNMFKPGHLKCSVQHTLNKIDYVCDMNSARNAVPWSLRRELAMTEDEEGNENGKQHKTLRSYDIEIAVTVEPNLDDDVGPKKPLRAIQVLNGYMLRDPDKKNRLSVWFTGGKLAPFMPDESMGDSDEYGNFEDWKEVFDQEYTSSWSESLKNMGAKLLLGAQLPQGMQPDGSLSYSLTRPYGGHGKSFIDVLYLDEGLFITRGNNGTIHVMVRSNLLCPTQEGSQIDGCVKSATEVNGASHSTTKRQATTLDKKNKADDSVNKRKASDMSSTHDQGVVGSTHDQGGSPPTAISWQEALKKELAARNKDSIADDLSKILQEYGIQLDPTTKKAKFS